MNVIFMCVIATVIDNVKLLTYLSNCLIVCQVHMYKLRLSTYSKG